MQLYPPGRGRDRPVPTYQSRWDGVEGRAFSREVWRRLRKNETLTGLDLGEINGRLDLRAFPIPSTRQLADVRLDSIDFTEASLELMELSRSVVNDCRFDRALCIQWRLWAGVDLIRCSFAGADLSISSLGIWRDGRGNRFHSVDFSGARMEQVSTSAAEYVDCDFSNARLSGVNFWQSSLIRCTFAGRLAGVIFDGRDLGEPKSPNPMSDVDFSAARIDGCDFRGVSFDGVRLPDDPDIFVFRDPTSLQAAIDEVEADAGADADATAAARVTRKIVAQRTPGHILINVRDFGRHATAYRELLTRAADQARHPAP